MVACGHGGGLSDGGGDDALADGAGPRFETLDTDVGSGEDAEAPGPDAEGPADTLHLDAPYIMDAFDVPDAEEVGPPPECQSAADCPDDPPDVCYERFCVVATGACGYTPVLDGSPCDSNPCQNDQACFSGACQAGTPVSCKDEDVCTSDGCDPAFGCTFTPVDGCCTADCTGKECGDDGCGGSCGTCPLDNCDLATGTCPCVPDCSGKTCGSDGCGGSCGACPDGTSCESAYVVGPLPFVATGDTGAASNDYGLPVGTCPGGEAGGGEDAGDEAYALTPPAAGTYRVTVEAAWDALAYVVTDCEAVAGTCLGAGGAAFDVWLEAETTAWVIIDGLGTGAYTLTIEGVSPSPGCEPACEGKACGPDGCGALCGGCSAAELCGADGHCDPPGQGASCGVPFVVGTLPFTGSGSTAGAPATYTFDTGVCDGVSGAGGGGAPDEVFAFTPPQNGNYELALESGFDAVLYVAGNCASVHTTCLGAADELDGGGAESMVLYLLASKTYSLIVDGAGAAGGGAGEYTLSVSAWDPAGCEDTCGGKVCGPDGCGGWCGACGTGLACAGGVCAPEGYGALCTSPYVVGNMPWQNVADTGNGSPDYSYSVGACPGVSGGYGLGGSDHAYKLKAPIDGTYFIELEASFDATLYAVTDCEAIDESCLEGSDFGIGSESISLTLSEGEIVFVIVDAATNGGDVTGPYTITFGAP